MSKKASVNDILIRIQATAAEKGVNLTYTNKMVYLKLLDYAEQNKETDLPAWVRIRVTTLDLAKYCDVSAGAITASLKKFNQCGLIKYVVRHPYPSVVTLYKRYYE